MPKEYKIIGGSSLNTSASIEKTSTFLSGKHFCMFLHFTIFIVT